MNTAQKVREHKEKRPELYCTAPRCLWQIVKNDGSHSPCRNHPLRAHANSPILGRPFSVMLADAKALEEATDVAAAQQAVAEIKQAMKYPALSRSLRHREEDA